MLATPLRSAFFILTIMLAGWLLIVLPARGGDLPTIHYVAAPFVPYTVTAPDGKAAGPTAHLIETLSHRLGRPATLDILPFARALATTENEPNTLIALFARSPERETRFHWVCPVLDYEVQMFRRRNRMELAAARVADLKTWRIAGVAQDVKTLYLERNGVSVIPAADENEALRLLLYGRVDAIASHPAAIRQRVREMGERGDPVENFLALPDLSMKLYLAFGQKTAPEVAAAFTATCNAMIRSGEMAGLLQAPQIN